MRFRSSTRVICSTLFFAFLSVAFASPMRAYVHADCVTLCDSGVACVGPIEQRHSSLKGCGNYAYNESGYIVYAEGGSSCRLATGSNNQYTMSNFECTGDTGTSNYSCEAAGVIACKNSQGAWMFPPFSMSCEPKSIGGAFIPPAMHVYNNAVQCSWPDGTGVKISCADGTALTTVW